MDFSEHQRLAIRKAIIELNDLCYTLTIWQMQNLLEFKNFYDQINFSGD